MVDQEKQILSIPLFVAFLFRSSFLRDQDEFGKRFEIIEGCSV